MRDPAVEALVWEQAVRGLDRQATVLSELRQRASIVLSATGIVASLLGSKALDDGHPRGLVYAALALTTLSILLCILVLRPVRDTGEGREWKVTVSRDELADLVNDRLTLPVLRARLIDSRGMNFRTIARRSRVFLFACALLPPQIICWAIVLLS